MFEISIEKDSQIICSGQYVDLYLPEQILRTRPKVKMKIDFTDEEIVQRSPFYSCNRLWDKLDAEVQLSSSPIVFANSLRKINLLNL